MNSVIRKLLGWHGVARLFTPLVHERFCIFTLHRFGHSKEQPRAFPRTPPERLARILERLRNDGYSLLDLEAAMEADGKGVPPRSIVFTVDDGYHDIVTGAEVFLAYDCPVTVFLTTGFVDGQLWLWWDQIEYLSHHLPPGRHVVHLGDPTRPVAVEGGGEPATLAILWERCKGVADEAKEEVIDELAGLAGITLPEVPPADYAPVRWETVRELESRGLRFAPHTVSHPILTRTSYERARQEIGGSWTRLREEVRRPVPVLAYPNGKAADFGEREVGIARQAGLRAALTTVPGYARPLGSGSDGFRVPRFGEPADPTAACLLGSGLYRAYSLFRSRDRSADIVEPESPVATSRV